MPVKKPRIQLSEQLPKFFGTTIAKEFTARLGDPSQNDKVYVTETDKQGLVYVHGIGDTPSSAYTAENSANLKELLPNRLVLVKPSSNGRLRIIGVASEDSEYMANVNLSDQVPVYHEQIVNGGLAPNENDTVLAIGAHWIVDGIAYKTTDKNTGDLLDGTTNDTSATGIEPPSTAGLAKLVLVQEDPTTDTLSYKQSSTFPATYSLDIAIANSFAPSPDSDQVRKGYVKLINGMTSIQREHVFSMPDIYRVNTSSGSGNIDITGTQGETLAVTDIVYQNDSDNEWYKVDTNATSPPLVSGRLGVIADISDAPTVTIRTKGSLDGFTGLSSGNTIYASTTAGGYTQTRPDITDGGGQLAIIDMGYALDSTTMYIDPKPIRYMKRETLADDATTTIQHHSDAQTRIRKAYAYVASSTTGTTITGASYGSANQDTDIGLQGATLSGDSLDTAATFSGGSSPIGDISGTEYGQAQSYLSVNGGVLTQFTFDLDVFVGGVSGNIDWSIHLDDTGSPASSPITSGSHAPTASATNTVNLTDSEQVVIPASTTFWVVYQTSAQPTNGRYVIKRQASSSYAGGEQKQTTNGGASWSSTGGDLLGTVTLSAITSYEKLGQEFQQTSGSSKSVGLIKLWLKKVGTPSDTLTLRVETSSAGDPSGTLANVNATADVSESSLSTSYGWITFTYSTPFSIGSSTVYHLVLSTDRSQSDTDYVVWGADSSSPSYANGIMHSYASSTWSDISGTDAIFELFEAGTQFDEPLSVGSVSGDSAEIGVRFDDGSGSDGDTRTTFKNLTGVSADIVCEVEFS